MSRVVAVAESRIPVTVEAVFGDDTLAYFGIGDAVFAARLVASDAEEAALRLLLSQPVMLSVEIAEWPSGDLVGTVCAGATDGSAVALPLGLTMRLSAERKFERSVEREAEDMLSDLIDPIRAAEVEEAIERVTRAL